MDARYIKRKTIRDKDYVFDPSDIYDKVDEKNHKYLDEYLNTIMYNYSTLNLESIVGTNSRTKEHINFRVQNSKIFYELARRYATYYFCDEAITTKIGLFNFEKKTFRESDMPEVENARLREKVLVPLGNDIRKELMKIPKKALYPAEEKEVNGMCCSQMWLIGKYKDQTILFRLYKEETRSKGEYLNQGSGISLEVFIRGRRDGGKHLTRSDFKPLYSHVNLMDGTEYVQYGLELVAKDSKFKHDFTFPDHTHKYNLGFDIVLPKYSSTDIKLNETEYRHFADFEKYFLKKYNIDDNPIYEKKDVERNASLAELAKKHIVPPKEHQGGLEL